MTKSYVAIALFLLALLFVSCEDKTLVGVDIVNGESINYTTKDDFNIRARTIPADRLASYRSLSTAGGGESSTRIFMLGEVEDPFFGRYSSEIYIEPSLSLSLSIDSTSNVLDSIVLILDLDTLGRYGDTTSFYDIEVFRVIDDPAARFSESDTIYADESFPTEMIPIGSRLGYRPNYFDSIRIDNHTEAESATHLPQLRIPLDNTIGEFLLTDDTVNNSDSTLKAFIPALKIVATTAGSGFIGLNLVNTTTIFGPNLLRMYYTSDTLRQTFDYGLSGVKSSTFTHDISGTDLESTINDFDNAALLYLQGMQGPNVEFDLSDLDQLSDNILNKVELEIFVAELPGDDVAFYSPVSSLLASQLDADGELVLIDDISILSEIGESLTSGNIELLFGGNLTEDEDLNIKKYTLNLTNYIKSIYDGEETDYELILSVFGKSETPNRSIIFGEGNGDLSPKLTVTFTQ